MLVLKAVTDGEIWIGGGNVGNTGSLNDINVLNPLSLLTDILQSSLLFGYKYKMNETDQDGLYFLIDGIYPSLEVSINTISELSTKKEHRIFASQKAMRKDMERAFGVLLSGWSLLVKPCLFWDRDIMEKFVQTAVILDNMKVEGRRDGYDCNLCSLSNDAVPSGTFLDANEKEIPFT